MLFMLFLKNEPLDFLYASNFFTPAMPGESLRCLVQRGESSTVSPPPLQLFTTTDVHEGFGFAAGRTGRRQWPGVSTS